MQISVKVKPGSRQLAHLEEQADGSYVAFLTARAHDGEANKALIELVAKQFKVPKTSIKIVRGDKSRQKLLEF